MDAETRGKVKALEAEVLEASHKTEKVIEENVRLEKKVYEMQGRIDQQADLLADYDNISRENERLTSTLREIAYSDGGEARWLAQQALNSNG